MSEDYFWGVSLSGTNKEHLWEPDALKENGGSGEISLSVKGEHSLIIKQALLGAEAKAGEVNVVEVETSGYKGNVKIPILTLIGGKSSHVLLDLNFPDPPVTIKLVQGSGPIHLSGNHVINAEQYNDDDDDLDEDEFDEQDVEEDDDEEELEESKAKDEKTGKKRGSTPLQSQTKKKKKSTKEDD